MVKLPLKFEKSKANYRGVLVFLDFFLFLDFDRGILLTLDLRILLKKILLARDSHHAIQVAHESPYNNQNPTSTSTLGVMRYSIFGSITRVHEEDLVELK